MKVEINAYPFVIQRGTVEVPDGMPEDELEEYILEHWQEIRFEEPFLDYEGATFDVLS